MELNPGDRNGTDAGEPGCAAPACQNFPCTDQNPAALVCYHKECAKMTRKPYRLYCMKCDIAQHEDAPYHVRTTVTLFQSALHHYTPNTGDDLLSPTPSVMKRDRFGSGRQKRKSPEASAKGNTAACITIQLPNKTEQFYQIDSSLLRAKVEMAIAPLKLNINVLDVTYPCGEHINLDNYILGLCGQVFHVTERDTSNKSPKSKSWVAASKLGLGHFKWRREAGKTDRTWSVSGGGISRPESIAGARSLTALDMLGDNTNSGDSSPERSLSTSASGLSISGSVRTNKKLAKLLGADDDGQPTCTGADCEMPSAKSSKLVVRSLADQLEMFGLYGISRDPSKPSARDTRSDFWLPSTWTGLTENIKSLSKRNIDEQEAIWELLTTQVTHAERLWTMTEVFRETLIILQERGFLTQVKVDRLYLNISDLKELDDNLWRDVLSNVFKEAKSKGHLLKASMVADCFDGFAERFGPYIEFCGNQPRISKYLALLKKEDPDFLVYLKWCESHPTCNRLALTDMLAAPFQRLTKYPLLLKAIMKKTNDDAAKDALHDVLLVVERFLGNVNQHVSVCQRRAQLQAVADRLDENFVEVPPEFDQYVVTGLNLQDRMWTPDGQEIGERGLVAEESFRLKEFAGKFNTELKFDALVFLFSDMLLITKPKTGGRLQIVKPPLMISAVSISRAKDPNTLFIVHIHSTGMAQAFFVLQAHTPVAATTFAKAVADTQFSYRSLVLKRQSRHSSDDIARNTKLKSRHFSSKFSKTTGSIFKGKRGKRGSISDIPSDAPWDAPSDADHWEMEGMPDEKIRRVSLISTYGDGEETEEGVIGQQVEPEVTETAVAAGEDEEDDISESPGCQLTVSFCGDPSASSADESAVPTYDEEAC